MEIAGRPLLGRVLDRSRRISGVNAIVVATSSEPADDAIAAFAQSEGVSCFRGDLNNVAARAVAACDAYGFDGFLRVCGDRPFFDPKTMSELIELFQSGRYDLVTTKGQKTPPPGLTGEVVRTTTLRKMLHDLTADELEHVTGRFYTHPRHYTIKSIALPDYIEPETRVRLVVDDALDLERASAIAVGLGDSQPAESDMAKVISLAENWDRQYRIFPD